MRIFFTCLCFLFFTASTVSAAPASFGIRKDGRIDQAVIAKAYKNSDWDEARQALEGYLKRKGDSKVALDERIFAYKYLGVISAADSNTMARAESYFHRLLDLSPKIDIVDLFASKKINEFFQSVKRDHEAQKAYLTSFDTFGHETKQDATLSDTKTPAKDSMPSSLIAKTSPQPIPKRAGAEMHSSNNSSWVWWTVGVAAVAGVGATAFYLNQEDPPKRIVDQRTVTPE